MDDFDQSKKVGSEIFVRLHDDLFVLQLQPVVETLFFRVTDYFHELSTRFAIADGRRYATYVHAGSLHTVYFVGESVGIVRLPANLECSFGIVFDHLPGSGIHSVVL
jgi:hypothetical protein